MKKKSIIILLVVLIILLIGGGIITWKLSSNKSNPNQQKPATPLNQLSDQELEKVLLEDFSRRLELEKYFVFNLGELTKEPLKTSKKTWTNGRIVKPALINDLTEIAKPYTKTFKKKGILFLNENYGIQNIDELNGEELDKKIDSEKHYYIIFEKNAETKETYFSEEYDNNFVRVKIKPFEEHVFESKEKALSFLKNDPSLQGKA